MRLSYCICAFLLHFFDAALDGATANREIPDRFFSIFYQFDEG